MIDTDIFWIIFAAIVALFVALFTIRVRVDLEMADELKLSVLAFGVRIRILPKKPKKYNIRNYTLKKIAKRDQKAAKKAAKKAEAAKKKAAAKKQKKEQEAKLTKEEKKAIKAQKRAKLPRVPDMIPLFLRVLKTFFSGFLGKFHFRVMRIKIAVGSADAATTAMMYSGICTAMKPVLKFLDKHSNLHGMKNAVIEVTPDFLSDSIKADVKMSFSMSIGGLLGVVFKTAFKFLFGWMKITPKSNASAASTRSDKSTPTTNATEKQSSGNKTESSGNFVENSASNSPSKQSKKN